MNLHFGVFAALIRFLPTDQFFHKQHRVFCFLVFFNSTRVWGKWLNCTNKMPFVDLW